MFSFRKKIFLFTYGSYFWGYKYDVIKAKTKADAVYKFLNLHELERKFEQKNPNLSHGDFNKWEMKEIEVIK